LELTELKKNADSNQALIQKCESVERENKELLYLKVRVRVRVRVRSRGRTRSSYISRSKLTH